MTSASASSFNVFWVNHSDISRDRKHPEGVSVEGNSPEIGDKAIVSLMADGWVRNHGRIPRSHTDVPEAETAQLQDGRDTSSARVHGSMGRWVARNCSVDSVRLLNPKIPNHEGQRRQNFLVMIEVSPKTHSPKRQKVSFVFGVVQFFGWNMGILWTFFVFICLTEGLDLHLIHLAVWGLTYTRLLRGFRMVRVLLETSDVVGGGIFDWN